jgi:hypothetical protein
MDFYQKLHISIARFVKIVKLFINDQDFFDENY